MKILYDQILPERSRSFGAKSEETIALVCFLGDSTKKNMVIEYDDEKECKKRYNTIRRAE